MATERSQLPMLWQNYILTNGIPTVNFVQSVADVDGVRGITIADVLAIANIILGM